MKKLFIFCLAGVLAIAATSCDKDDREEKGISGTMTVNGQTGTIQSAFFYSSPNKMYLDLYHGKYSEMPDDDDFNISIALPQDLVGQTLDLVAFMGGSQTASIQSYLFVLGIAGGDELSAQNYQGEVSLWHQMPDDSLLVTAGTLIVNRSGDKFSGKVSLTLSDGSALEAVWRGTATEYNGAK